MNKLAQMKKEGLELANPSKEELNIHLEELKNSIYEKNIATGKLIKHASEILDKKLWAASYKSEREFVKSVLHIDYASLLRLIRANKIYQHLSANTEDEEEKIVLELIREFAYRRLRELAVGSDKPLKKGQESEEDYLIKLKEKEKKDIKLIKELWDKIYPIIKRDKYENNKVLLTGGFYITDYDMIIGTLKLQTILNKIYKIITENNDQLDIDNIAKEIDVSPSIIRGIISDNINQEIINNIAYENQQLRQMLSTISLIDKYRGYLSIANNRLILVSAKGPIDLMEEFGQLIESKELIMLTIRRKGNFIKSIVDNLVY